MTMEKLSGLKKFILSEKVDKFVFSPWYDMGLAILAGVAFGFTAYAFSQDIKNIETNRIPTKIEQKVSYDLNSGYVVDYPGNYLK